MKDLSQNSVARITGQRRPNKSIWNWGSLLAGLVVVIMTVYGLVFPARTVEKTLICTQPEHVHDDSCWLEVLRCEQDEGEASPDSGEKQHIHDADCYTRILVCGMEEHVHSDECYAEPEPIPELTQPLPEQTELSTKPPADEIGPVTEPLDDGSEQPATEPWMELVSPWPGQSETQPEPGAEPLPGSEEPVPPETTEAPALIDAVYERPSWPKDEQGENVYPETGVDLAPYLDSAIFYRQEGGALVDDVIFENGETAKARISYSIPRDIVTPQSKYVYYQLPEGIRPIEESSGDVIDDGQVVGIYTITENGLIHILFCDAFANGNDIQGAVEFICCLYANDDGTDRVIEFENQAGTITVIVPDEQKYDLAVEKTGTLRGDYQAADFVLTVSTERGTGAPVTVEDLLTNQTPQTLLSAFYTRQLSVVRVRADGSSETLTGLSPVWAEDGMSFCVQELPALEAGERYELRYSVALQPDLSGSFELDNEATVRAGSLEAVTSFFISYVCDISKTGTFNPATGLIDWVIAINPESRPVAGWRIEDDLPYPAVGKVLLTNANGVRYADLTPADGKTIRYSFPANAPAKPYFIRYSTTAPSTAATVRNSVRLINDRDITVVSEVVVDERAERADKTIGARQLEANGTVRTSWSFQISLPIGQLDSFSFRDIITNPVRDVGTNLYLDDDLHYSYAAELEAAFRGNLRLLSDCKEYRYGDADNDYVCFVLSYYDSQGELVAPDDTETHVARVFFNVLPLQGNSFHGYEIRADDYPTWLDVSQAQENDTWSYANYIFLHGGVDDMASGLYRKSTPFRKQLLVNEHYSSDDSTVSYQDCGGELEYRLLLDLTVMEGSGFEVTDLLPAELELVEGSPRVFFTKENLHGEYEGVFCEGGTGSFQVTAEPAGSGASLLRFTGEGVTELMKQSYAYVGIVYKTRLRSSEGWDDYSFASVELTNSACWNDYSDARTVRLENEPKRLEKTGVQLQDSTGAPLGRVRFSLLINAGAEDLDPEQDWITLTDVLSANLAANLELGSVSLYHCDPSKPERLGAKLMPYEFSLSYEPASRLLTVRLRDETAYILRYDYSVDNSAILDGETAISNNAELCGVFHSHSSVVLRSVSSSATAWQRMITVTKVDSENNSKVLPGAEFRLEYWDLAAQSWRSVRQDEAYRYVSDEEGKISLSLLETDHELECGTLYRLTETKAPLGYANNGTVLCFLCEPRNSELSQAALLAQAGAGSGVTDPASVRFFGWNGGNYVIDNPFCGLTVDKRWYDQDGLETEDPVVNSITVRLYVSTDPTGATGRTLVQPGEGVQNPVRITKADGWTYTWDKLPDENENGEALYYFVEEDPVRSYTTEYMNNGIKVGTIVISNRCEPFELPSTGGRGVELVLELGLLLIIGAVIMYKIFKKLEDTQ